MTVITVHRSQNVYIWTWFFSHWLQRQNINMSTRHWQKAKIHCAWHINIAKLFGRITAFVASCSYSIYIYMFIFSHNAVIPLNEVHRENYLRFFICVQFWNDTKWINKRFLYDSKMKWAIIRARNKMFTWYWTWTEKKWNRIKNKCSEKLETNVQCVENPWWSSCDKTQFSDSTIL